MLCETLVKKATWHDNPKDHSVCFQHCEYISSNTGNILKMWRSSNMYLEIAVTSENCI
jgi:hypothetical protein